MKMLLGALGAGVIAAALLSTPAQARCAWNGYAWHCWRGHTSEFRADRHRLHAKRHEVRQDRRHINRLQARLHRDIHVGSSSDIARDRRALRNAHRELRSDRHDLRGARRDLREDRWGR